MTPTTSTGDSVFIRRTLIVLGLAALAFVAWQLRSTLMMVFAAVVVATLVRSLADLIRRFIPVPPALGLALAVFLIVAVVAGSLVLFGAQIASQTETLRRAVPLAWESLQDRLSAYGLTLPKQARGGSGEGFVTGAMSFLMSVGGGLTDALLIVVGGIFLAGQPRFYEAGVIKLVPEGRREIVSTSFDDSARALRLWLKAQLVAMVLVGVLTWFGLWLVGVPSSLALGFLAGLLEFVPYAGPVLSAIPAILVALTVSPQLALWTSGLYLLVHFVEGYVIQPVIQQWAVELPGFVLLFALLAAGVLFGPIGVLFAAPLTVVLYVMVKRLYVQEALDTPTPIPGEGKA